MKTRSICSCVMQFVCPKQKNEEKIVAVDDGTEPVVPHTPVSDNCV
jgi:hypothetical protein